MTTDESGGEPPDEALYGALAHKRRRYTLHYLRQQAEPVSVQALAEQVAAWENETTVEALTAQQRKRVYVALYQSHLSTMDGEGLVEYDERAGTVELSEPMRSVDLYLEVVGEQDVPWSVYYGGLVVANAVLVGLTSLGVAPFDRLPALAVSGIVLVSFGLSAFAQLYYDRQMQIGDEGPPPELQS